MNSGRSAIVFFSTGPSDEQSLDLGHRQEIVDRGLEAILSNIEGISLVTANKLSSTASVTGAPDVILRLNQFVEQESLGHIELDAFKPAFRAS